MLLRARVSVLLRILRVALLAAMVLPVTAQTVAPSAAQGSSSQPPSSAAASPAAYPAVRLPSASGASSAAMVAGITQAYRDIRLGLPVAGRIEAVMVREGQRVRRGDLLLHLDRQAERLEVDRRRLLLQDQSRLEELRTKEKVLIEQIASLRPLVESGAVSRKQLEDEELALGTVVAEYKTLEFAKQREQVELNIAIEAYEKRHLRAPIDGIVTKISLRAGESVNANEPVLHLADPGRVRFIGNVPAAMGARISVGSRVTLNLGQDGGARRVANVVFVSPVTDPSSGLVEVIAEFENADGSIKPGVIGRLTP